MNNNVNWLVTCPSNDCNFKNHLEYASAEEVREALHIIIGQHNPYFDTAMLSKMECDRCLPTPLQLAHLAAIYGCTPLELVWHNHRGQGKCRKRYHLRHHVEGV